MLEGRANFSMAMVVIHVEARYFKPVQLSLNVLVVLEFMLDQPQ